MPGNVNSLTAKRSRRVRRFKFILLAGPYVLVLVPLILALYVRATNASLSTSVVAFEQSLDKVAAEQSELSERVEEISLRQDDIDESVSALSKKLDDYIAEMESKDQERPKGAWPKKVYLTFDDGPSSNTAEILDILKQYGVKGNFFVVGTRSESLRPLYRRYLEEGHVLGMHSYSHEYSEIYASKEAFAEDLDKIRNLILEETGYDPTIYRFPAGSSNTVTKVPISELVDVLNERGITYYDWNVSSGDATNPALPADEIVENALKDIDKHEETMILMHDLGNKGTTVEALPRIIEALQEQGIPIATIDETTLLIQHATNQ